MRAWKLLDAEVREVLQLGARILVPVEKPMGALRLAADLHDRPQVEVYAELEGLSDELRPMIRALWNRAQADPELARRMQVAVFQYGDARRAVEALRTRVRHAATLDPESAVAFMEPLPLPKVRGKIYVVTNFGRVFAGDPLLGRMFPVPRDAARTRAGTAPQSGHPLQTGRLPGASAGTRPLSKPPRPAAAGAGEQAQRLWRSLTDRLGVRPPGESDER